MGSTTKIIDCYKVLGVTRDATIRDINSAYKKLALKHHPDKAVGEGSSRDEFQKIQQAVEILRDPVSRKKHDKELFPAFYEDEYEFPPGYTGWRPHMYSRNMDDRYRFSYGNSVHMDPYSNESAEERAYWEQTRKFGHSVPESSAARKSEWEVRVDRMGERIRRENDVSETQDDRYAEMMPPSPVAKETDGRLGSLPEEEEEEEDHDYQAQNRAVSDDEDEHLMYEDQNSHAQQSVALDDEEEHLIYEEQEYDERVYAEGQPQQYFEPSEEEKTEEEADQHPEYIGPIHYDQEAADLSSTEYETANQEDECLDPDSDSGPEEREKPVNTVPENDLIDMDDDTSSCASFYEAKTAQSITTTNRDPALSPIIPSLENQPTALDRQLAPFVPYFKSKLEDPSQRYTWEDVSTELEGIVLETYCGWLEALRLSFPDARPLPEENDSQHCAHLGYWRKEFGCSECETCGRWRPLYVLTCPGCGIRRCVECKFTEWKA